MSNLSGGSAFSLRQEPSGPVLDHYRPEVPSPHHVANGGCRWLAFSAEASSVLKLER